MNLKKEKEKLVNENQELKKKNEEFINDYNELVGPDN